MQGTALEIIGQRGPRPTLSPASPSPTALYVHVPFCFHKCHYCDFYSLVDTQDRQDAFADALTAELADLAPLAPAPLTSLFVGGGTPTLLRADLWERLLDAVHTLFGLGNETEFTVECNPETASAELFAVLARGGVNRLSIGAQSFDPRHLKTLERWHDPASVPRTVDLARAAGITRTSADLIFAVPGQTLDEWQRDLRTAIDLGVEHVSAYALTFEPGTAMTARRDRGEVTPADHDLEAEMFVAAADTLRAHGYERYEISNFARPGAACRHNLAYWRQEQWLAAGPSAAAHVQGWRWKNAPNLRAWMDGAHEGSPPVIDLEPPDPARALAERIMTGLRLTEGLDADSLRVPAHGLGCEAALVEAAARMDGAGWLEHASGERWRLTEAGVLMGDHVAGELMAAIRG